MRIITHRISVLILTSLFSFSGVAYSQNCKPALEKTDKFSKKHMIFWGGKLYESQMFSDRNETLKLYVVESNSKISGVILSFRKSQTETDAQFQSYRISKGDKLYILMDNGEAIEWASVENAKSSKDEFMGKISTKINVTLKPTKAGIDLLYEHLITDFRLVFSEGGNIESKVPIKLAEKFKAQIICLYNKYP